MVVSKNVADQLASAQSTTDRGAAVQAILTTLNSSNETTADDLMAITDFLFADSVGIVSAKAGLDSIINVVKGHQDDDVKIEAGAHILGCIGSATQSASFLDQTAAIADLVATSYETVECFEEAARVLETIPLDSSQRRFGKEDKAMVWIRIVRDYLEADNSTAAESYLNRLKGIILDIESTEMQLHFKLSQARINDTKREFLAASTAYHDISYSTMIGEDERLHTLRMAVRCAILAPAGPSRSRVLARLYKDDRTVGLEEFPILEKIFLDRLLSQDEVDKFAERLQPHQLATTSDGSTVLAKAIVEHNLLGVSRLYRNIQLTNLAKLLGLDASKAEETTARMIEQGRLVGRIDQIDGVVWFEGGEASGQRGSGRTDGTVDKELRQWDANVQSVAEEVENITNALQKEFPAFVARHLAV